MLFMIIYTYEPEQRNETTKRRLHRQRVIPEGMKVIGEWSFIGGGRGFMVLDAGDPKLLLRTFSAWSDLLKFEVFPVIETEEIMKLAKSGYIDIEEAPEI